MLHPQGIKLQMAVSFPEIRSIPALQKVPRRWDSVWTPEQTHVCALLASYCPSGCICVGVQLIYSRFQESHSIPGLSLSLLIFFSDLRGSQTKSFSFLDSADSSLKILLLPTQKSALTWITISLNAKPGPLTPTTSTWPETSPALSWGISEVTFAPGTLGNNLNPTSQRFPAGKFR